MTTWHARAWRKKSGKTLEALAADLGTSVGYLSDMEKGTRRHNSDWNSRIAQALGLSPSDLYRDPDAQDPASKTVAVVGLVGAGSVATLFSEGQGPFDYVEAPHDASNDTVALGIRGASLGPAFDEGIVFYDDVRSPITPDLFGRLCVVGLEDGRVLVKIVRHAGDGTFHLMSNTMEEPLLNERVLWAARVKEVRPR